VIGGDDSNTNAAFLAEYFLKEKIKTRVVGVPKTIDGDLKNGEIEVSFGFDTACKTYAATISSIARDALSAKKYYYFIKLMGRTASHVALECALQVHPNMTLISEEIKAKQQSAKSIAIEIANMIAERAAQGKDYGVILVPEGLLEAIEEIEDLIAELNRILKSERLET
ncbi:MAG TPA: 6-phosphofructokinase, partial [Parachlamydiaceae bacterium]|nr:6-phosphofructokinase [Parachlamydiaceae bacterium]